MDFFKYKGKTNKLQHNFGEGKLSLPQKRKGKERDKKEQKEKKITYNLTNQRQSWTRVNLLVYIHSSFQCMCVKKTIIHENTLEIHSSLPLHQDGR